MRTSNLLPVAGWAALALACGDALAANAAVDTTPRMGTLVVTIDLKGKQKPQPYSLDLSGQPVKNSKGQPLPASLIESVDYDRKLTLRISLQGSVGAGSGFSQIDKAEGGKMQDTSAQLMETMARCRGDQACMDNAAKAARSRLMNVQRYLVLSTRPDPATGKCGTATAVVNDRHVGRNVDAVLGWVDFDYYRQGRQEIPASDLVPKSSGNDKMFLDTSRNQVSLCGSKVAIDRENNTYHLQLSGISPQVKAIQTSRPQLAPIPIQLMGDGESKLLFLNKPGGGMSVSIAPFEIKNFYTVTGAQGQAIPVDATISWAINVVEGAKR